MIWGRGISQRTQAARTIVGAAVFAFGAPAIAGPEGGEIVGGAGAIARPDAVTTQIQQYSQAMAVNWSSFNVAASESVQFIQPSAQAVALNRILDQNPSQIFGRLDANGAIFLINQAGVVFGESAQVNVASLVASTLDMNPDDFMAGRYELVGGGNPAAVINRGLINAAAGGSVALVGGQVVNTGLISAKYGRVTMAGAEKAYLDFDGDGLIRVEVTGELQKKLDGADAAVSNAGQIEGGEVILQAAATRGLFDELVNNEGVIKATRIDTSGGVIRLVADGGDAVNSGTLDVSSVDAAAGVVEIAAVGGDAVNAGVIKASSVNGAGGTVRITAVDGDAINTGEIKASSVAGPAGVVQISAAGGDAVNAGTIEAASAEAAGGVVSVVASAGNVVNEGSIAATSVEADGGFIEFVADADTLLMAGEVDAGSVQAVGGVIHVLGNRVAVAGPSRLGSTGGAGGGTILIGGDFQGRNPSIRNATKTYIGPDAVITADAVNSGSGGRVIIWSDEYTRFFGTVSARGPPTGLGGFVEVSGKGSLVFAGAVEAAHLLLDPDDLCITNGGDGSCTDGSAEDTSTPFDEAATGGDDSYVTKATLEALGNVAVTLQAGNNVIFEVSLNMSANTSGGITVTAGNAITMAGFDFSTGGGALTLNAGAGGITNLGTINTNGGLLTINTVGAATQNTGDAINGSGGLAKQGAGTFILSQANGYTGLTTVSGGILQLSGSGTLGSTAGATTVAAAGVLDLQSVTVSTEALTLNGGTSLTATGTTSWAGTVSLAAASTIDVGAGTFEISGAVSGAGANALTKAGGGTLKLSGGNSALLGQINVSFGTLSAANANALGSTGNPTIVSAGATLNIEGATIGAEDVTLNGGTALTSSGAASLGGSVTLSTANSTIDVTSGTLNLSGNVGGGFGFIKAGPGQLTLSGATNSYSGSTLISLGTLVVQDADALGAAGSGTQIDGGRLILGGTSVGAEPIVLNGGTLEAQGISSSAFGISLNAVSGNTIEYNGGAPWTLNGAITGPGGFNKTGTGDVRLAATNNYSGTTTVSNGTLVAQNGAAINDTGAVVVAGGAFEIDFDETVGSIAGTTGSVNLRNNTLTVGGNDANTTLSVIISDTTTGNLVKTGAGTLTLSGPSTFSGAVTITGGTISVNNVENAGTASPLGQGPSAIELNGGTLEFTGGTDSTNRQISITGTGTVKVTSGPLTISGAISGGALTKTGAGTLILGGTSGYTGLTTVSEGILSVTAAGALGGTGAGTTVLSGATLNLNGSISVGEGVTLNDSSLTATGSPTLSGALTLSGTTDVIDSGAGTFTISGAIGGTAAVSKLGSGILLLSGTNNYSGITTVSAGTLRLQNGAAIADNARIVLTDASGVTLNLVNSETIGSLSGGGATGGNVTLGANTLTIGADNTSTSYDGVISGTGGIVKSGGGILTLTRASSFTGTVTVNGGKLSVSDVANATVASPLGAGSGITIDNATLLFTATVGDTTTRPVTLTGTATIEISSATGNLTLGGNMPASAGGLTKTGPGTLTLTGSNAYTGATLVTEGVLNIRNATATGTTAGGVVVSTGAALEIQNGITVGAETLALNGNGVGSAGALRNVSGTNSWTGTITLNGNTEINSDSGQLTLAAINAADFNLTLGGVGAGIVSGVIATGNGSLTKSDGGIWSLNGANTYTGVTSIDGGVLAVATLANGGAPSGIGDAPSAAENLVLNGGTLRYTGAGANTDRLFTLTELGGTIEASGSAALSFTDPGAIAFTGSGARTLTLRGTNVLANTFMPVIGDGGGGPTTLTKADAGTWALGGPNTYTGVTNIDGGVLSVASLANGGLASNIGAAAATASNLVLNSGTLRYTGTGSSTDRLFTLTQLGGTIDGSGAGAATFTGSGNVAFTGSGTRTLTLTGTGTGNALTPILGDGAGGATGITKSGAGSWTLGGANTYSGTTLLSLGTLRGTVGSAFGTSALSLAAGTLELVNDASTSFGNNVTVTGSAAITVNTAAAATANTTHTLGTLSIGNQTLTLNAGSNMGAFTAGLTVGAVTVNANGPTLTANTGTLLTTGSIASGGASNTVALNGVGGSYSIGGFTGNGNITTASATGTITFTGAVTATALTIGTTAQNVALLGGGTITNAVTFGNSGTVTLNDASGDTLTFSNGVTATAPSQVNIAGTIATGTNQAIAIVLGDALTPVIVTADTILSADEIDFAGVGNVCSVDCGTPVGRSLTLRPVTVGDAIRVSDTGTNNDQLDLTTTDIAALDDGFSSVNIGVSGTTTGTVTFFAATVLTDPVAIGGGALVFSNAGALTATSVTVNVTGVITSGTATSDIVSATVSLTSGNDLGTSGNPVAISTVTSLTLKSAADLFVAGDGTTVLSTLSIELDPKTGADDFAYGITNFNHLTVILGDTGNTGNCSTGAGSTGCIRIGGVGGSAGQAGFKWEHTAPLTLTVKSTTGDIDLMDNAIDFDQAASGSSITLDAFDSITDRDETADDDPGSTTQANVRGANGVALNVVFRARTGTIAEGAGTTLDIDVQYVSNYTCALGNGAAGPCTSGNSNISSNVTSTFLGVSLDPSSATDIDPTTPGDQPTYTFSNGADFQVLIERCGTADLCVRYVENGADNASTGSLYDFSLTALTGDVWVSDASVVNIGTSQNDGGIYNIGAGKVTLTANAGRIGEINDNTNAKITTSGLITLSARDGIGGSCTAGDCTAITTTSFFDVTSPTSSVSLALARIGEQDTIVSDYYIRSLVNVTLQTFTNETPNPIDPLDPTIDFEHPGLTSLNSVGTITVTPAWRQRDDIILRSTGLTVTVTVAVTDADAGISVYPASNSNTIAFGGSGADFNIDDTLFNKFIDFGTFTVGEAGQQTGVITVTTVNNSNAATDGASYVINSNSSGGGIVLTTAASTPALVTDGAGNVTLRAGTTGVTAGATTADAEISTTGTVTITSAGPVGTSVSNRLHLASGVGTFSATGTTGFITGLGSLSLGDVAFSGLISLSSSGAVTQAGGTTLTAAGLDMLGTGPYTLENAGNDIDSLAGNVTGNVSFTDDDDLTVTTVNTIPGLTSSGTITLIAGRVTDNALLTVSQAISGTTVTLAADNIQIGANVTGSTALTIKPLSAFGDTSDLISLGGSDAPDQLGLQNSELAFIINTPVLTIGDTSAGIFTISIPVTRTGTLNLVTGSSIVNGSVSNVITVPTLSITSNGDVGPGTAVQTDVSELTVVSGNGNQNINEAGGLTELNLNSGNGDITLTVAGSIASADSAVDITGDEVTITGVTTFGVADTTPVAGKAIETNVRTLSVSSSGDQWILESSGLEDLNLSTSGNIALAVAGAIQSVDAAVDIAANLVTITGATTFGLNNTTPGNAIETTVNGLSVTSTGSQFIRETNGLTELALSAVGQAINLEAGGSVQSTDVKGVSGAVEDIIANTLVVNLTAGSFGQVGPVAGSPVAPGFAIETAVADLTVTTVGANNQFIYESDSLSDLALSTGTGSVNLRLATGSITDTDIGGDVTDVTAATISLATPGGAIGASGAEVETSGVSNLTLLVQTAFFVAGDNATNLTALAVTIDSSQPGGSFALYRLIDFPNLPDWGFGGNGLFDEVGGAGAMTIRDISPTTAMDISITNTGGNIYLTDESSTPLAAFDVLGGNITVTALNGSVLDFAASAGAAPADDSPETDFNVRTASTSSVIRFSAPLGSVGAAGDGDIDVSGTGNLAFGPVFGTTNVDTDTTLTSLGLEVDPARAGVTVNISIGGVVVNECVAENACLTVNVGNTFDFQLTALSGDILLGANAIPSGGADDLVLTARNGGIFSTAAGSTNVTTAGTVVLTAATSTDAGRTNDSIGSATFNGALIVDAASLTVTRRQSEAFLVNSTTNPTAVGNITLRSTGAMVLAGFNTLCGPSACVPTATGALSLRAVDLLTIQSAISQAGDITLRGSDLTVTGSLTTSGTLSLYGPGGFAYRIGDDLLDGTYSVDDGELLLMSYGTLQIGESTVETGAITLDSVTVVGNLIVNANGAGGGIVLDDTDGTAVDVSGTAALNAGSGGITAANAAANTAELDVTGALTLSSAGALGTSTLARRIEFAADQDDVTISSATGGAVLTGIGNLTLATVTTGGGLLNITTASGGNLTFAGSVATSGGSITVNTGAGTVTQNNGVSIASGTGFIFFTSGNLALNGAADSISGSSTIVFNPNLTTTSIGLAGGSGTFNLTPGELDTLANGFTGIFIGIGGTGQHAINVNAYTFDDSITLRASGGGAALITLNGNLSTTGNGAVSLNGPVSLGADLTISTGAGQVNFGGIVNGAQALTVDSTGSTIFTSAVGGGTPLTSLTTNAGGTTFINGGSVQTTADQTYNDNVSLGTNTTLGAVGISFGGTLDGTFTLDLTAATGSLTFTGLVGNTSPLGAMTVNSALDVTGNGIRAASFSQIAGTGTTTLNNGVFGSGAVTTQALSTTTAGGVSVVTDTIALSGRIDTTGTGPVTLTANNNNAGGGGAGALTIVGAGDIFADGPVELRGTTGISTAGDVTSAEYNITYFNATTLTGAVAVSTGTGAGGNILFSNTLDGGSTLDLTAGTGNITFSGLVGNTTPLGAITINSAFDVSTGGIRAASFVQSAGTGTTTLNSGTFSSALPVADQALRTTAVLGVSVTTDTIALNGRIDTSNDGPVTLTANNNNFGGGGDGRLVIAAAGDIVSDGAVQLTGGTISTGGDVTTTADNVTYVSATTLTGPVAVSTGSGAGDIAFSSTLDGGSTLGVTAGTGSVTFSSLVGNTAPLGAITINSAFNVNAVGIRAASLVQSAGTGTTTLANGTFSSALPVATQAVRTTDGVGVSVTTDTIALNGRIDTSSSGPVTLTANNNSGGGGDGRLVVALTGDIFSDGAVQLTGASGINTAGDVTSTDDNITYVNATTLAGGIAVSTGASAGGNILFSNTLDGGATLTLTAGTGNVTFSGLTGDTAPLSTVTVNSATDVTVNGLRAVSFSQVAGTGTTTLNAGAFGGAPTPQALGTTGALGISIVTDTIAVNGRIDTSGTGPVTLTANDLGGGAVGTLVIVAAGDIFSDGAVQLRGAAGISTAGDVTSNEADITYFNATTLTAPIAVSTGAASGGSILFSGTLDGSSTLGLTAGTGNVTFSGLLGDTAPLGAITINSAFNVNAVGIRAASFVQLAGTGTTTLNGGTFGISAPVATQALATTAVGGVSIITDTIALNGRIDTSNNGPVTLTANNLNGGGGAGTLAILTTGDIFSDGVVQLTGASGIVTGGDVTTTDDDVTYVSPTLLTAPVAVSTGSGGAGNIVFSSTLDGGSTLGLTAGTGSVTFTGLVGNTTPLGAVTINSALNVVGNGIRASSFSQVAGTGTTTLANGTFSAGTVTVQALATTALAGVSIITDTIQLDGQINTSNTGPVTLTANSLGGDAGTLTIAGTGDIFSDGAVQLRGASGISTGGDVTTTDDDVTYFDAVTLTAPVLVGTGGGGAGNIVFSSTLDGAATLGLAAGTGSITFTGLVGNTTPLGSITINSALDVTTNGVRAASFSQLSGIGTTTLNTGDFGSSQDGALQTTAVGGVSVITDTIALNGRIDTTGTGPVTLTANDLGGAAAGTLIVAAAGDIFSDGAVQLRGANGISTAADVTTTEDDVTYFNATTLTGAVVVDTGAANVGSITFGSTLNGTFDLTLTAGTGSVAFNGVVGNTAPLGAVTINSALDVTGNGIRAASFRQLAGTGTTTLNAGTFSTAPTTQALRTTAALGVSIITDTIAVNSRIDTTGAGPVTLTANDLGGAAAGTLVIAAAGDITSDGAVQLRGANGISTGGDVTTTDDDITYFNATTLTGPLAVSTGATDAGNITFSSNLDGTTTLNLTAGTGNIVFTGPVGSGAPLGAVTIVSANDVTAAAMTLASLTQQAGSGTTALNGAFTSSGAGLNLTTGTVTLTNVTANNGGNVQVSATGLVTATSITVNGGDNGDSGTLLVADNGDVTLATTGGITVGSISAASDFVYLNAGGAITDADGGIGNSITASLVNLVAGTGIGTTGTAGSIETTAATVNADTATGGIFINSLLGAPVLFSLVDADAGAIELRAANNISLGTVDGISTVDIITTNGSINDDVDDSASPLTDVFGTTITLQATTGIGTAPTAPPSVNTLVVELNGAQYNLASTSGGVAVADQNATGTRVLDISTAGIITFISAANIQVDLVESTNGSAVTLQAGGYIFDDADGNAVDIIGGTVTLTAVGGIGGDPADGGSVDPLEVASSGLDATASAAGADIYIADVAGASSGVFNDPAGSALLLIDTNGGNIVVTSAGALSDNNGTAPNIVGGPLSINALGAITIDNGTAALIINDIAASGQAVTLTAADISQDGDADPDIVAGTLNLVSSGGIDLDTTVTGAVVATAATDVLINNGTTNLVIGSIVTGGLVNLTTTGTGSIGSTVDGVSDISATGLILSAGGGITLDTSITGLRIDAAGGTVSLDNGAQTLVIDSITATNQSVTLSTTGSVVDTDTGTTDITADALTVNAGDPLSTGFGDGAVTLDTNVTTLNVTSDSPFSVVTINEASGLATGSSVTGFLLDLTANGPVTLATDVAGLTFSVNGNLTIDEASDVILGGENTAVDLDLEAVGDIVALDTETLITADNIRLVSQQGIIGTIAEPIAVVTDPATIFATTGPDQADLGFISGDNFTTADFRRVLQISNNKVFVFGAFTELIASVQGSFITAPSFTVDASQFRTDLNIYGVDGSGVTLPFDQCEDEESLDCAKQQ